MNLPGSFLCSSQEKKQRKKDEEKNNRETCILSEPGQSKNELNPYWKNGGTGLPQVDDWERKKSKPADPTWLKRALQRAREQAIEEGRSLEEVAAERWGVRICTVL